MFVDILAPPVVELVGGVGAEFVVVDVCSASTTLETIERLVLAAKVAEVTALVRILGHDPDFARRALDLRADGIVVPRVRTRDNLDRIVSATKYHPDGQREHCSLTRSSRYTFASSGEEFRRRNEETVIVALVEDEAAVDNVDELFETDQLDAALLGPGDLS